MITDSIPPTANKVRVTEVLESLDSTRQGLTTTEVEARRQRYGYNEVVEPAVSFPRRIAGYFRGPIPLLILFAALVSVMLRQYLDFGIMGVLFLSQAGVALWRDRKNGARLARLAEQQSLRSKVHREDVWSLQPARELVPGDIIYLQPGDIVSADVKLIGGTQLTCRAPDFLRQKTLEVHLLDELETGTVVLAGEMIAVVERTGERRKQVAVPRPPARQVQQSPIENRLVTIGNYFALTTASLACLLILASLFRHDNLLYVLRFASLLIVASVPAAFSAIFSAPKVFGSAALAGRQVFVKDLPVIEHLAAMDVLCTGKTGILTRNVSAVGEPIPGKGYAKEDVFLYAALASPAGGNHPIDALILEKLQEDRTLVSRREQYRIIKYTPFSPETKRSEVIVHKQNQPPCRITKGAPQAILALVNPSESQRQQLATKIEDLAGMGYHTIGVALAPAPGRWRLVGLVPLFDPPRKDSAQTISAMHSLGVKVKILTGDTLSGTKQLAYSLNMGTNVIQVQELEQSSSLRLDSRVKNTDGFAELFPDQKNLLIRQLQRLGHTVGMTGDSIGDAPAVAAADCGFAVAGATDAVREAANIMLGKRGIGSIVEAIKESRNILQRLRNYAIYRLAESLRVVLFLTIATLGFHFFPVTAGMVALYLLLSQVPLMPLIQHSAPASRQSEDTRMGQVLKLGLPLGLTGVAFAFVLLYVGTDLLHLPQSSLQSFLFLHLVIAGQLTFVAAQSRDPFWSATTALSSKSLIWPVAGISLLATLLAIFGWLLPPIGWKYALLVWGFSLLAFVCTDGMKAWIYRFYHSTDRPPDALSTTLSGSPESS